MSIVKGGTAMYVLTNGKVVATLEEALHSPYGYKKISEKDKKSIDTKENK